MLYKNRFDSYAKILEIALENISINKQNRKYKIKV